MRNLTFGRHVAAVAAALLASTACIVGAVGPATAGHASTTMAAQVTEAARA